MSSNALPVFLDAYEDRYPEYVALASKLEDIFRNELLSAVQDIQAVAARAKSPDSLRLKVLLKGYTQIEQLQDLIGVRVITYYSDDVDQIAATVRTLLNVDERNSHDPRQTLVDDRRFGYRSLHLVGSVREEHSWVSELLRGLSIEVQIRTVLDHVWAELEHRVIYKSGAEVPTSVDRSYLAIAGSLELLEHNFLQLRQTMDDRISVHRRAYRDGYTKDVALDAARLVGLMEARYPDAVGWRRADRIKAPFQIPPRTVVAALRACGIRTGSDLWIALDTDAHAQVVSDFAALVGEIPRGITHLSHLGLLIGSSHPDILNLYCRALWESDEYRVIFPRAE